jgi:hypothetical protein
MSFSPNAPLPGDFLAISQKQILANFQAIANTWLIDHVPLTAVEDVGKHISLTLRPQAVDPTTLAGQSAIYNKLVSTVPQLFFRPDTNQTPIQLSNSNLNTLQTGASPSSQSSFLAGPFTIYFGFIPNATVGQLITLLPATTLKYVGLSTVLVGTDQVRIASTAAAFGMTANQFQITYNNSADGIPTPPTIYYTAIGI